MRNRILLSTVFSLCIFLFLASAIAFQGAGDPEVGREAFGKHCRMCHGEDGKGNPQMAAMLQVEFPDMASEYIQSKEDDEIKDVILNGTDKMPKVTTGITEDEIPHVIAFIRSLKASAQ